ncbi:nitrate reductase [Sulfitobacter donghicola]|uniref:Nitrate reductase n=1 Tax=Sulfitobacter donghicola DSW-25 = KCTC 12864 = JCM 14565 TaxID=1300350 RepID=A0A073IEA9_9RHOB|nr:nitrate reductase [Sulfitobacter donghicola]KEJ88698.1 nitrate reductase [Sulfitobacter donghicola DSW-25 = KCTC 12864 = JCM 14565]KIN68472.1 putative nitrate reductase, large subunit protein [Sulfitobacter donghicola DSW-25 = KCTC 12864 = JCM 14565]
MSLTKTVCPYCGVGCGLLAGPDGTIKGDPDHPANFGRLCSKGAALGETIGLEGRLLTPKVAGRDAAWDDALDLVAQKFGDAIRDHGPDSVAIYASGQILTEDYYVANKLMKGFVGSANIDTNSRLCMASSVAGHKRAFGTDTVPAIYEDLEQADLIVLVGSNLAWCHPVLHQRISAAKAARPALKIVNVDPRKTATTGLADQHLRILPDGDAALFNGLLAHLADTDALDHDYLKHHVNGHSEAVEQARLTNPLDSGLSQEELDSFFALWAGTEKVVTVYSQGVNQSGFGTDKVNAILNCHLATGRIGKPGCSPFSVTGQPNAMGGREVGGLANILANHLDIENPDHRASVQAFWQSPTIASEAGLKAVDLFQACASGKIKALWVISTNPAVSLPDADGVAEAIKAVPFVAVSEINARTDTGDLADVLLPAAGWGEKNGTVTNSERRMSRQRAFMPAPGETRPDWLIISQVASRMGWGDAFSYSSPAEVFAEFVALSKATREFERDLDLSGFEEIDYDNLIPTQWPKNGQRFFADGKFFHADGKAKMLPIRAPQPQQRGTFTFNTGRNRDQWHTMSRSGKAPRLGAHLAEPYAEIHPDDAARLSVGEGDLVTLSNQYGTSVLRALITDRTAKQQVFAPMHWTRQQSSASWINNLAAPVVDPVSGQPASKMSQVTVKKYSASWYGFAASLDPIQPQGDYAAVARTLTGWQGEFAGLTPPADWEELVRSLLSLETGNASLMRDESTQQTRVAFHDGEKLVGLFYAASEPVTLARAYAVSLIGTDTSALQALAGRSGADQVDPGATVCACLNVGINTLREAIAAGAGSIEALGTATCAGTSCGSCKPELARLLDEARIPMAAE